MPKLSDNIVSKIVAMEALKKAERAAFKKGVKFAAEIADSYNSVTNHPYRLGDCILAKLNQTKRKPRKNKKPVSIDHMTHLKNELNWFDVATAKFR